MSENTTPNLQPEVSLPIAPTIGEIDHFRIINKNGQSQKATITQVRELMGIDYSKLEEQIVHGEYWMGVDGVRRQVYTRTIIINGTIAAGSNIAGFVVFPDKKYLVSVSGSYVLADAQYLIGVDYTPTLRKLEIDSPLNNDRVWYNLYSGSLTAELFTIVAAIKYTKQ